MVVLQQAGNGTVKSRVPSRKIQGPQEMVKGLSEGSFLGELTELCQLEAGIWDTKSPPPPGPNIMLHKDFGNNS